MRERVGHYYTLYSRCENDDDDGQGLKCTFKVVGAVKPLPPVKICGPFQFCSGPCISSQAVIVTKFRFTSCVLMDKTYLSGPMETCVPMEKALFSG